MKFGALAPLLEKLMTDVIIPIAPHAAVSADSADPELHPGIEFQPSERNRLSVSQRKLEKRIIRLTAQAITDFNMIEDGDKVMVAMSGGKDSYVLLDTLKTLQARAPIRFELLAVNVHQHIPHFPLETLRKQLEISGVPYHIEDQDTNAIIERLIPEGKNVCSLCARLRRGILYRVAGEFGCTKIALGHHMDDVVSTFLLNLFYGGRLKAMPPKLRSDDGQNIVIRPLVYVREYETEKLAKIRCYPTAAKGICGAGENLKRKEIKTLIRSWDREFPGRVYNTFMSLQRVSLSHLMDKRLFDFDTFSRITESAASDAVPLPTDTAPSKAQP